MFDVKVCPICGWRIRPTDKSCRVGAGGPEWCSLRVHMACWAGASYYTQDKIRRLQASLANANT